MWCSCYWDFTLRRFTRQGRTIHAPHDSGRSVTHDSQYSHLSIQLALEHCSLPHQSRQIEVSAPSLLYTLASLLTRQDCSARAAHEPMCTCCLALTDHPLGISHPQICSSRHASILRGGCNMGSDSCGRSNVSPTRLTTNPV